MNTDIEDYIKNKNAMGADDYVEGYYEKKGYREKDTFMVKDFWWGFVWLYIALYCKMLYT